MNKIIIIITCIFTNFAFSQEVHRQTGLNEYTILKGTDRAAVCDLLADPFSLGNKDNYGNISSVSDEISKNFSSNKKFDIGIKNVNTALVKDTQLRCSNNSDIIFELNYCKDKCKSEFHELSPSIASSVIDGKKNSIEMCIKMCKSVNAVYYGAINGLFIKKEKYVLLKEPTNDCVNNSSRGSLKSIEKVLEHRESETSKSVVPK